MQTLNWIEAVSGAIALACGMIGLFFVRFWLRARDRFFLIFAVAFWILMLERLILIAAERPSEVSPFVYIVRLTAFLLIIVAVVDKNRKQPR